MLKLSEKITVIDSMLFNGVHDVGRLSIPLSGTQLNRKTGAEFTPCLEYALCSKAPSSRGQLRGKVKLSTHSITCSMWRPSPWQQDMSDCEDVLCLLVLVKWSMVWCQRLRHEDRLPVVHVLAGVQKLCISGFCISYKAVMLYFIRCKFMDSNAESILMF